MGRGILWTMPRLTLCTTDLLEESFSCLYSSSYRAAFHAHLFAAQSSLRLDCSSCHASWISCCLCLLSSGLSLRIGVFFFIGLVIWSVYTLPVMDFILTQLLIILHVNILVLVFFLSKCLKGLFHMGAMLFQHLFRLLTDVQELGFTNPIEEDED